MAMTGEQDGGTGIPLNDSVEKKSVSSCKKGHAPKARIGGAEQAETLCARVKVLKKVSTPVSPSSYASYTEIKI